MVKLISYSGRQISEDLILQMWTFRLSLIQLRADVSPKKDFADFREYVKNAKLNSLLFRKKELVGMLCLAIYDLKWPESQLKMRESLKMMYTPKNIKIFNPDYFFLEESLRRSAWPLLLHMRSQLYCILRFPIHKKFVVALGYPSSFLSSDKLTPGFFFLGEEAPVLHLEVLKYYLRDVLKVDNESLKNGVVKMKTKPKEGEQRPRSKENQKRFERYVLANPQWHDGYGIAFVTNLSFVDVVSKTIFYLAKQFVGIKT